MLPELVENEIGLALFRKEASALHHLHHEAIVRYYVFTVEPILQRNCQTCHRPGQIAPMSFFDYQSTRPWAKAMKAATIARKMPPWFADPSHGHFLNDRSLKQNEIETIAKWADLGAPEGDAKDAPASATGLKVGW